MTDVLDCVQRETDEPSFAGLLHSVKLFIEFSFFSFIYENRITGNCCGSVTGRGKES